MQSTRSTHFLSAAGLVLWSLLTPFAHAQPAQPESAPAATDAAGTMAPPLPRVTVPARQGLQSLEVTAGAQHLTGGFGPWRELALRGAYALPGQTLQAELSAHHRFGVNGAYAALTDTLDFTPEWYGSASIGAGDGAFYLPRYRVDLSLSRKLLPARNLVTTVGTGYYKAPDDHRDRSLLIGAAYYFERAWILEGGARFNESNPGSVHTTQTFVALTFRRPQHDVVTARVGWGGEGYLAIGPSTQLVNFRSHEVSVSWRHWVARNTAVILAANYYRNPLYARTGATVGVVHQF